MPLHASACKPTANLTVCNTIYIIQLPNGRHACAAEKEELYMGIIGLVLGVVGLVGSIVYPIMSASKFVSASLVLMIVFLVLAIAGIVISAIAMKKRLQRGAGIAGLVVSIIGVVVGLVLTLACVGLNAVGNAVTEMMTDPEFQSQYESLISEAATDEQVSSFLEELTGAADVQEAQSIIDSAIEQAANAGETTAETTTAAETTAAETTTEAEAN